MSDTLETVVRQMGLATVAIGTLFGASYFIRKSEPQPSILQKYKTYPLVVKDRLRNLVLSTLVGHGISMLVGISYFLGNSTVIGENSCYYSHIVILLGSSYVCRNTPTSKNQIYVRCSMWFLHSIILGIIIGPLFRHEMTDLLKIMGRHAATICCLNLATLLMPAKKHSQMKKYAFVVLITVMFSTVLKRALSESSMFYQPLNDIDTYGGFLEFCLTYSLDLQSTIEKAEVVDTSKPDNFDYIGSSLKLLVNSGHLFMRIGKIIVPETKSPTNTLTPVRYTQPAYRASPSQLASFGDIEQIDNYYINTKSKYISDTPNNLTPPPSNIHSSLSQLLPMVTDNIKTKIPSVNIIVSTFSLILLKIMFI